MSFCILPCEYLHNIRKSIPGGQYHTAPKAVENIVPSNKGSFDPISSANNEFLQKMREGHFQILPPPIKFPSGPADPMLAILEKLGLLPTFRPKTGESPVLNVPLNPPPPKKNQQCPNQETPQLPWVLSHDPVDVTKSLAMLFTLCSCTR